MVIGGSQVVTLGGADYAFPGVRIALWGGGLITLVRRMVRRGGRMSTARTRRDEAESTENAPDAPMSTT